MNRDPPRGGRVLLQAEGSRIGASRARKWPAGGAEAEGCGPGLAELDLVGDENFLERLLEAESHLGSGAVNLGVQLGIFRTA